MLISMSSRPACLIWKIKATIKPKSGAAGSGIQGLHLLSECSINSCSLQALAFLAFEAGSGYVTDWSSNPDASALVSQVLGSQAFATMPIAKKYIEAEVKKLLANTFCGPVAEKLSILYSSSDLIMPSMDPSPPWHHSLKGPCFCRSEHLPFSQSRAGLTFSVLSVTLA